MRRLIFEAVLLCTISEKLQSYDPSSAQSAQSVESRRATVDSLRGRYRPLLVFAPRETDQRFQQQLHIFAGNAPEMHDRNVVIVPVIAARMAASPKTDRVGIKEVELREEDAAAARERFHIAPHEFVAVLIGKDGGEKLRSRTPVTMERLNAVIDAMPMRRQEMQNGNSK